ncbi:MAG: thiamine phosphate synthase [Lachnospiraceae bacterium]|nr:thiamine phosphate synthase [Lachnospiraceae bacterium]
MRVLCITNRGLSNLPWEEQIRKVISAGPDGIILREKDLTREGYLKLADQTRKLCLEGHVPFFYHGIKEENLFDNLSNFPEGEINAHLTMREFKRLVEEGGDRQKFHIIGVSTHSVEEAVYCQEHGADYITASHIFPTDCKKGLAPRGLAYLSEVCRTVKIPVYALGGINPDNAESCLKAGAYGVCVMSLCMREDADQVLKNMIDR